MKWIKNRERVNVRNLQDMWLLCIMLHTERADHMNMTNHFLFLDVLSGFVDT